MKLILASRSPQRVALLRDAGFDFQCEPADIDESTYPPSLTPPQIARYLASAKANAVAEQFPGDLTLGADTIVAHGDQLLGKPVDALHAQAMLRLLSGSTHAVITGICLRCPSRSLEWVEHVESAVSMRQLTDQEVAEYVAGGAWQGKAGGYGLQDDDPFVTCVSGSATNIIGLPMERVIDLLRRAGFN